MVYELIYLIKFIKFFESFLLTEALLQFTNGAAYVLEDADKFVRQGIQPRGPADDHPLGVPVGDVLTELKNVVNITTLSMTDKERMDVVESCYSKMKRYRNLVSYYTNKNISVSYLRAKKKNDLDRIMGLYGNANERYW